MKDIIQSLTTTIRRHDHRYYVLNDPEISDAQYDAMFEKLLALEAQHPELADPNSPTSRVGNSLTNAFKKYPHQYPMLSVKSYYSINDLIIQAERHPELVSGSNLFSIEHKLDGMAIELEYRDNKLYRALTRGNGFTGEDITDNIRTIKTIPLQLETLNLKLETIIVRGEVVVSDTNLKAINAMRKKQKLDPLPNNRNAAATLMMSKKSGELSLYSKYLEAWFYETNIGQYHPDNLAILKQAGFKTIQSITISSLTELPSILQSFNPVSEPVEGPTDGFVIKINDLAVRATLGENSRHVNWAFALKQQTDIIETKFLLIDFSMAQSGTITPIVHFTPIVNNGVTYKSATTNWKTLSECLNSQQFNNDKTINIVIKGAVSAQLVIRPSSVSVFPSPVSILSLCPACKQPLSFGESACKCENQLCPGKTGDLGHLKSTYKMFDAGSRFCSIVSLRYAAKDYDAPIVRKTKGTSQTIIFYRSVETLSKIIFNAAQL